MMKKFARLFAIAAMIGGALGAAPAFAQKPSNPAPQPAVAVEKGPGPEHLYPTEKEEADLHAVWYRLVEIEAKLRGDQEELSKAVHALPEWKRQEADGETMKAGIDELTKLGNQILADHAKGDPEIAKKFRFNPQTAQFDLANKPGGAPAESPGRK